MRKTITEASFAYFSSRKRKNKKKQKTAPFDENINLAQNNYPSFFCLLFFSKKSTVSSFLPEEKKGGSFYQKIAHVLTFRFVFTKFIMFTFLFKQNGGIKKSVRRKLKAVRKSTA